MIENDPNTTAIFIDHLFARYIGIGLMSGAPFTLIFFQVALMIRTYIIKKREEYNSEDEEYTLVFWTSTIMSYIAIFQFIIGAGLLIKSF